LNDIVASFDPLDVELCQGPQLVVAVELGEFFGRVDLVDGLTFQRGDVHVDARRI
jgi:hypothetical protein